MTGPSIEPEHAFIASEVEKAPAARGVYALHASDGRVIFLGRAFGNIMFGTIRDELGKHLAGHYGPCTQKATQFGSVPCDDPEETLGRYLESHLLAISNQGKLPECNPESDRKLLPT